MPPQARSFLFAIGIFAVIGTTLILYRKSVRIASTEAPGKLTTAVNDIRPGSYHFDLDLYNRMPGRDTHRILFLRKNDGTLKAWYFTVRNRYPTEPNGDWFTPGQRCDPFDIDSEHEEIRCVVTDRNSNRSVHLRWSWDGKSSGPFAPDMAAVPGKEDHGDFVFDQTSPYYAPAPQPSGSAP